MLVRVLGSAAGVPQWNCGYQYCVVAVRVPAEAVIGLRVSDPGGGSFVFALRVPALTGPLLDTCRASSLILLDGTFFSRDELVISGTPHTARQLGHLPVGGPDGSLAPLDPAIGSSAASARRPAAEQRDSASLAAPGELGFRAARANSHSSRLPLGLLAELTHRYPLHCLLLLESRGTDRAAFLPSAERVQQADRMVQAARLRHPQMAIIYVASDYYEKTPKPCMNGWGSPQLTITPDGTVLPCPAATVIRDLDPPNIADASLAHTWSESPAFTRFRGTSWLPEPCHSCPAREADFGGCRCQAYQLLGDAAATAPVCHYSPRRHTVEVALAAAAAAPAQPLIYRAAALATHH